ncbi:MAG: sugar phosphate isomerase/epimerase [Chloroflexi bacterium]|nr:sugar phosphate isomerase/epimerase [Chloroflexota bacterium]
MTDIRIGINMEYVRHEDRSFEYGVRRAAEIGYRYVEPCVLNGRDLLSEANYYHFRSMQDDPREYRRLIEDVGLRVSALSAHSPLMRPEVAVDYLIQGIRWASDLGAPVVNTDEMWRPAWMDERWAFEIMRYTLARVLPVAERYGIFVALEPHGEYTTTTDGLERILALHPSPLFKVNFDTGNSYLAGAEPYDMLEHFADRVVHVHAKDISLVQSTAERGKVTGTPTGCACGDGVVDWRRIVEILARHQRDVILSVECTTEAEAIRSLAHLQPVCDVVNRGAKVVEEISR